MKRLLKYSKYKVASITAITSIAIGQCLIGCTNDDAQRIQITPQQQPTVTSVTPSIASPGDTVVVGGTNFSQRILENSVEVGGTKALVIGANPDALEVIVPSGASSGSVSVTVLNYTSSGSQLTIVNKIKVAINAVSDDAEEVQVDFGEAVGTMDLTSSDLEIGEVSSGQGLMNIGLRFNSIKIPKDAKVNSAYIQFMVDNDGDKPVEVTIYGEDASNPKTYTEELGNLSSRPLTSASVVWSVPEWVNDGDQGPAQATADISSIVQEIVNRPDWSSGKSINFIIKNSGESLNVTSSSAGREAEVFTSSNPDKAAIINVEFQ